MKEAIKNEEKTSTLIGRFLLWLPGFILVAFLFLFAFLQIPSVQTNLISALTNSISSETSFKIKLEYANLTWYDKMLFEDIEIYDTQDSLMLKVEEAKLNIGLFNYLINKELKIDELIVSNMSVHLQKPSDSIEVNINQFFRELKQSFGRQNKKKTKLIIDHIELENGLMTFDDRRKKPILQGKDYYHFGWDSIQTEIDNLVLFNDTLNLEIESFYGVDLTNQLNIKSLSGKYFFGKKSMSLFDYTLVTDNSELNDSITLRYDTPSGLKYFVDSVDFSASFKNSSLSSKDISLFSSSLRTVNKNFIITGNFQGSIKKLIGRNVQLKFGKNTHLDGNMTFNGLPNINETFIDINIFQSKINPLDIINFIPNNQQEKVLNAGIIDFSGHFLGFVNDFVAKGNFNTEVGIISSDVNFKVAKNDIPNYSGGLVLKDFDLGIFLNDTANFQKINLEGSIKGSGLEKKSTNFLLNAAVESIGVRNYDYQNISTNGKFANEFFEGQINVEDPNLILNGFATVNLRADSEKINIKAELDTIRLKPLGLSNNDLAIASSIDADLKGLHIDSIKGYIDLHHIKVHFKNQNLSIDSMKIISYLVSNQRIISLETDGLSGELKGNFKNSSLARSVNQIMSEIEFDIINDSNFLKEYYTTKMEKELEKFNVEMNLKLWDINRFIKPFYPEISFSKNIIVNGNFDSNEITRLSLNANIDTVFFREQLFIDNKLDLEISKYAKNEDILSSFFISSQEHEWNNKTLTENFYLESVLSGNHMELTTNLEQPARENKGKIRASVDFLKDSISFKFLNSEINFLNESWKINPKNRIIYTDSSYYFENVALEIENQFIAANGTISRRTEDKLYIGLSNFGLENFNTILPIDVSGILEGNVEINYLDDDFLVEGDLNVKNLFIEEYLVGDIECLSSWENQDERLNMSITALRDKKKIIDVKGYFYPKHIYNQLDMQARFEDANLNIAEPFLKTQFEQISGTADGFFNISGLLKNPILQGDGLVNNGEIKVKYLNTDYKFDGKLKFQEDEIGVQNLLLRDVDGDSAVFNGGIFHDGFKNFVLDINGKFDNFKMLNTTSVDNRLYYGTAYTTGTVDFLGTIKNLQINATAKTEKNTKIFIPIGELNNYDLEEKEYINFIDLAAPVVGNRFGKKDEEVNLKGVKLDFDIEVTNDAYTELIFDVTAGDIIRGRGNGNLNLQIDTNGDFNMFGDYEIESGGYNFTLYNIINKEFEIQKGSQILWYGDPYGANLNIQAKYRQLASLAPLIIDNDNSLSESTEIRKVYPSIVDLGITGNLLSPDIKFDIDVEDYPNTFGLSDGNVVQLQTIISAFKTKLSQNEQEMKRQVFSLVILKKFSPENSFSVNSNTIGNSLSEFVSNQLSYWATQVDENLEIDVNLAGLDADAFNTFQLRLSYTFLDGRLRVTRGGGFSNEEKDAQTSSVIGDWTIEYLLTKDGRFRAKMYSRANLNTINTQLGSSTETGFSLQFVRSFDDLKRILRDSREQNNKSRNDVNIQNSEAMLPDTVKLKKPNK